MTHTFIKLSGSGKTGRQYCKGCCQKEIWNEIAKSKIPNVEHIVMIVLGSQGTA
jgi:hypothetical protein